MDLSLGAVLLLAVAGFLAGAVNAAAGGGSLISFPALLALGYPSLTANVTNNVAVAPGYVTGATGYRRELSGQGHRILPLAVASAVGSLLGVGLILVSSPETFEAVVPFLVLASCALLAFQPAITRRLGGTRDRPGTGALVGTAVAAVYGGYFSAALGVVVLAVLGLVLEDTLQRLNALKALLQLVIGAVSALGFALLTSSVAWAAVAVLAPASLVGGEVGARLARRVGDRALRVGIVVYGVAFAVWLFLR